jgi:acyl-CoA hydrolase
LVRASAVYGGWVMRWIMTTCASAPDDVSAPVSYGSRITAIILYL